MQRIVWIVLAALICAAGAGFAAESPSPPADSRVVPARDFDFATVHRLGRAMFDQNQRVTSAMYLMRKRTKAANREGYTTVVVDPLDTADRVRFVRETASGPEAFYEVTFPPNRAQVGSAPSSTALTPEELAQYKARQSVLAAVKGRCFKQYWTVALKGENGDWLVWAIGVKDDSDDMTMTGHMRFTVSADGTSVLRREALSHDCIFMDARQTPRMRLANLTVAHLLSDRPNEAHVMLSLFTRVPVYVITANRQTWVVHSGTMHTIQ
jgi:hypothetical protein